MSRIPPEAVPYFCALNGIIAITIGISKWQDARRPKDTGAEVYGIVASVHEAEDGGYVAKVEYLGIAKEKLYLTWSCFTQPQLGQSVLLLPANDGTGSLVVSDRSDNFTSAVVFIGIGLALIVAAGLTWKAFA